MVKIFLVIAAILFSAAPAKAQAQAQAQAPAQLVFYYTNCPRKAGVKCSEPRRLEGVYVAGWDSFEITCRKIGGVPTVWWVDGRIRKDRECITRW